MSARSLAVTGAVVVGAAFGISRFPIEPQADRDLIMILPFQDARGQPQDSTYLKRLAEALKNARTARDSGRIAIYRRALTHLQDSGQGSVHPFSSLSACPMPVETDSTALPMPTQRSSTKHTMPVLKVPCFNPLFAGVKPDSQ